MIVDQVVRNRTSKVVHLSQVPEPCDSSTIIAAALLAADESESSLFDIRVYRQHAQRTAQVNLYTD